MNNYKVMIKRLAQSLVIVLCLFSTLQTTAQKSDVPIGPDARKYTISSIKVTGIESYNENTVIAFSGLRVGEVIYLPGEKISSTIKKLWDLKLFSDIKIFQTNVRGDKVDLELFIKEVPTVNNVVITGVKKGKADDLKTELQLTGGLKANENFITTTQNFIENKYKKKGFLYADAQLRLKDANDSVKKNAVDVLINIDKGSKVKIASIDFEGNELITDKKLKKAMKKTKEKFFFRVLKRSKFIEEDYKADLKNITNAYKERGFRDARIIKDSISKINDKTIAINIKVEEGKKYYFGNIEFIGNTVYTDSDLKRTLRVDKGDVYNGVLFEKRISDPTDPDSDDISNRYQNDGFLFSRVDAVETKVYNDTIDFEIRIIEGKEAYFNNIFVSGNKRTNDHVIYRSLRTNPGERYSRQNILNSIRELGALGYFDAQKINPQLKNVSQEDGTVDVEYVLEETGASRIELQGGYGGGGFVGTLGLQFTNFSIRNLFNAKEYRPFPMGDGQTLALRAQASTLFRTYSLNFTEPWLGGKKPVSFNVSFSHSEQYRFNQSLRNVDRSQRFLITGGSIGIGKRLEWPDRFFTISHALSFQHINLQNFQSGLFNFPNGYSNNIAYTVAFGRNNVGTSLIYPTYGSAFNVTAKLSPPYSLWNGVDYANLETNPDFQLNGRPDLERIDQERFKYLEYYKVKFDGTWYTTIYEKLVLQARSEFGFLGKYNNDRGDIPFERFFVGGDGLQQGGQLDGRDIVRLRGYDGPEAILRNQDGDTVYNKFTLELRYPISLEQAAQIYVLTFLEAGNSYNGFQNYNPFELKRSAGAGLRIFMPAFGLLGVDFAYGFDTPNNLNTTDPSGWQVHFILGQQF